MNLLQVRNSIHSKYFEDETINVLLDLVDRQEQLCELLNDLLVAFKSGDSYSALLVAEMLSSVSVYEDEYRKEFGLGKE